MYTRQRHTLKGMSGYAKKLKGKRPGKGNVRKGEVSGGKCSTFFDPKVG